MNLDPVLSKLDLDVFPRQTPSRLAVVALSGLTHQLVFVGMVDTTDLLGLIEPVTSKAVSAALPEQ